MNQLLRRRLRDRPSDPATLISEGCKVTGTLAGSGDFMISGEVEGDCDLTGSVSIARQGVWKGKLKARAVIVAGTVTGEAIAVAEGAIVEGSMKTTGRAAPTEFVEKRSSTEDRAADS